jgi:hypothetical protein
VQLTHSLLLSIGLESIGFLSVVLVVRFPFTKFINPSSLPIIRIFFLKQLISHIFLICVIMGEALDTKMGEVSLDNGRTSFGKEMLQHFLFDPKFKNLNQGILLCLIVPKPNIDSSQQVPSAAFPALSAKSSKSTRKPAKGPLIPSSAMNIRNSSMSLEPLQQKF